MPASDRPTASSAGVRSRMQLQARRDTAPETMLRRILHSRGLRYRVHLSVPGLRRRTIDIAFPRQLVAVSVHGCWWHGCEQHGAVPVRNSEWWIAKIQVNRRRDAETKAHLEARGWTVIEVWEHENPSDAADRVEGVVRSRLASSDVNSRSEPSPSR